MKTFQIVAVVLVLSLALTAWAETKTWNGGSDNWYTAGQWSPSGVPTATDDAVVNSGSVLLTSSGNPPVTSVGSFSIASATQQVRLVVDSQKLDVAGELSIGNRSGAQAELQLVNGEIECRSFYQSAGSPLLFSTGKLTVNGGDFITEGNRLEIGGTMGMATLSLIGNPDWMVTYEEVAIAPGGELTQGRLELRDGRMMEIDRLTINEQGAGTGELLISGGVLDVGTRTTILGMQHTPITIEKGGKCLMGGSVEMSGNVAIAVRDSKSSLEFAAWPDAASLNIRSLTIENGGAVGINAQTSVDFGEGITITLNGGVDGEGTLTTTTLSLLHGSTLKGSGGRVVGDVTSSGEVAPGNSPGILTIEGDYTQTGQGKLLIELGGTVRGDEYDVLVITGQADLDGTLDIVLIDGYDPSLGDSFDVLDWNTLTGEFTTINLPDIGPLTWDTSNLYNTGTITVLPEPATISLLTIGAFAILRRRY